PPRGSRSDRRRGARRDPAVAQARQGGPARRRGGCHGGGRVSTGKRPSRFGDAMNPSPERRPLPLMTQPMIPVAADGEIDPSATRLDHPLATIKTEAAAVLFGRPTQSMIPAARPQPIAPVGPPPEIGLTQHHLPEGP